MPYEITNTKRGTSIIRAEGPATYTIQLSDLSTNTSIETVESASIRRVTWSTNGSIIISRTGGPIVLALHTSGNMRFDEFGYAVANTPTANIVCTIATGGSIILEVSKNTTYTSDVYS